MSRRLLTPPSAVSVICERETHRAQSDCAPARELSSGQIWCASLSLGLDHVMLTRPRLRDLEPSETQDRVNLGLSYGILRRRTMSQHSTFTTCTFIRNALRHALQAPSHMPHAGPQLA